MSYQVTMNIADSREEAQAGIDAYISQYYPELSKAMDLREWGPVGTPDDVSRLVAHLRRTPVSITSSAVSARSTNSGRSSGSHAMSCLPFETAGHDGARHESRSDGMRVASESRRIFRMSDSNGKSVSGAAPRRGASRGGLHVGRGGRRRDDHHRQRSSDRGQCAGADRRRAWRLPGGHANNEHQVKRAIADMTFPMAPPKQPAPGDGQVGRDHHHHQPGVGQPLRPCLGGARVVRRQRQDRLGRRGHRLLEPDRGRHSGCHRSRRGRYRGYEGRQVVPCHLAGRHRPARLDRRAGRRWK